MRKFLFFLLTVLAGIAFTAKNANATARHPTILSQYQKEVSDNTMVAIEKIITGEYATRMWCKPAVFFQTFRVKIAEPLIGPYFDLTGKSDIEVFRTTMKYSRRVPYSGLGPNAGRLLNSYVVDGNILFESPLSQSPNKNDVFYWVFVGPEGDYFIPFMKDGCLNFLFDPGPGAVITSSSPSQNYSAPASTYVVPSSAPGGGPTYITIYNSPTNSNTNQGGTQAPATGYYELQPQRIAVIEQPQYQMAYQPVYQQPMYQQPQFGLGISANFNFGNGYGYNYPTCYPNNYYYGPRGGYCPPPRPPRPHIQQGGGPVQIPNGLPGPPGGPVQIPNGRLRG